MANDIRPILNPRATVYKLTDQNLRTRGGFQWELEKIFEVEGTGPLCASGWLHAYSHPDLAVLLNPIHADFTQPRLFKARASGVYLSNSSLKVGVSRLQLIEELSVPTFSLCERVAWAIFVVRAIPQRAYIPTWENWADHVLQTRSIKAWKAARAAAWEAWEAWEAEEAEVAARAAAAAARAAAAAAARAAAAAAAARAAARAAAAAAWEAARAVAWEAWEAEEVEEVEEAAAEAAAAAARAATPFSLLSPHRQFQIWRNER